MPGRAVTAVQFVVKNWPRIAAAFATVNLFLQRNPTISARVREQLEDIQKRLVALQHRRSDAGRIRGMLDIVRDVARELEAQDEGSSVAAAAWLRRADTIERGVRLAEAQPRQEQKRTLARFKADAEALLAELVEATARTEADPAPAPPEVEPPTP